MTENPQSILQINSVILLEIKGLDSGTLELDRV